MQNLKPIIVKKVSLHGDQFSIIAWELKYGAFTIDVQMCISNMFETFGGAGKW